MEEKHKYILTKMSPKIVKDLNVGDILNHLIAANVVSDELVEELRVASCEKLLSHLQSRGLRAYQVFKEALKENDYNWMAEEMDELEQSDFNGIDITDASPGPPNCPSSRLPAVPPLNVSRNKKMKHLHDELRKLEAESYLALHALPGWGKSTLVGATLKKYPSLNQLFQDGIHWIKFRRNATTDDTDLSNDILNHLNELLYEVSGELKEATNQKTLTVPLEKYFSKHKNALIILDHAEKREIIDAFNFGCKTLVLTADLGILEKKHFTEIKLDEGFTVAESLDLFAKAIGTDAASLPKQAQLFHKECKGMPLMISMYAAEFQDLKELFSPGEKSIKIWSDYLEDLRKKSPTLQNSWNELMPTFERCIKNLDDRNLFEILSIFPEGVNITSEMLSIAWNVDPTTVNSKAVKFYKKSLVIREWHRSKEEFIYGVHDLMLRYLRQKLETDGKLEEYHRTYVERYIRNCNGDYSKLARDNYIYAYIGYHLEKGGLTDKFPEIYLNFGFIESKILETGPGDLLIDLKKYRKYITRNSPEITKKVEDWKLFLIEQASTLAEYRQRKCLDIVQVAFKHSNDGFVKETAEHSANLRPERLYFKLNKKSVKDLDPVSVNMQMQVKAVAFTNEIDMLLAGTNDGQIIWWNCRNRKSLFLLSKKSDYPIKKIVYSENGECFVSLSEDGTAKIFHLKQPFTDQYEGHAKTLDPWAKQENWKNINSALENHDYSKKTLSIPDHKISDIAISTDGCKIAVCTLTGYIAVWNIDGTILFNTHQNQASPPPFVSITYIRSDKMLCVANVTADSIIIFDASNGNYKAQFGVRLLNDNRAPISVKDKIISILPIPEDSNILVALKEQRLISIHWRSEGNITELPQMFEFAQLDKESPFIYTSAVVMQDGRHIVTADTGGSVNVYNVDDQPTLIRIFKKSVTSLDTRQLKYESGCQTICGCTNDTCISMVHKWIFDTKEERDAQRTPLFDAIIKSNGEGIIAVATLKNTIEIIRNKDEIAESDPSDSKITSLKIFKNGDSVVYSTENKLVSIFDIKHNHTNHIMELCEPNYFTTVLNVNGDDVIVCQNDKNDLRVWKGKDDDYNQVVQYTGTVIYCTLLKDVGLILTVDKTAIKIWNQNKWTLECKYESDVVTNIKCCSLNNRQNLLAIADAEGNMSALKLLPMDLSPRIKLKKLFNKKFDSGVTACNFSNDVTLLAVGLKNGHIIIMNPEENIDIRTIKFHLEPIKKLYWSPMNISEPILLSLSNELAWWSMKSTLATTKKKNYKIKYSQSENNLRSKSVEKQSNITSTTNQVKPKHSASLDFSKVSETKSIEQINKTSNIVRRPSSSNSSLLDNDGSISLSSSFNNLSYNESNSSNRNPNDFWNNKKGTHLGTADLLNVIKLDGNSATKIRISEDFSNFVTIDDEGSIYTLTILEQNINDNLNNPGSS